jgi:hypothetical protein
MDDPRALYGPPPVATPVGAPPVPPAATVTSRPPPRRQESKPPPKRRDSQVPASPKDADLISGLDPIAEGAAKDDKRLIKRLIKLVQEFNKTVQAAERNFDFGPNAQGGTIRIPDASHNQAIHRAVRELLEGSGSGELRRFQENSVIVNQVIKVSGV